MKNKLKTTSFWLGFSGATVLIIDNLSKIFDISICTQEVERVILSVCSLLVMLGIVTKKNIDDPETSSTDELLDQLKNDDKIDLE